MKRFWTLGACVTMALASGVVGVATASAAPPEYGRCIKKAVKGGAGYKAGCTKAKSGKNTEFEWVAGPGPKPGFTWQERPTYTHKYRYCLRALAEEQVAKSDREKAATAGEPEKAELESKAQEAELRSEQEYKLAGNPGAKYTKEQCEKLIEEEEAKAPAGFQSVPVGLEHKPPKLHVTCGGVEAIGDFATSKTVGVTVVFKECATRHASCQSTANEGEIVTSTLEGELGVAATVGKHVKHALGLALAAALPGAPFAEFTCGEESVVISGSVLTSVNADKMERVELVAFAGIEGQQNFQSFEGRLDVLETSIDGGPAEQTSMTIRALQENEEPMEANKTV